MNDEKLLRLIALLQHTYNERYNACDACCYPDPQFPGRAVQRVQRWLERALLEVKLRRILVGLGIKKLPSGPSWSVWDYVQKDILPQYNHCRHDTERELRIHEKEVREMRAALEEARRRNIPFLLMDRLKVFESRLPEYRQAKELYEKWWSEYMKVLGTPVETLLAEVEPLLSRPELDQLVRILRYRTDVLEAIKGRTASPREVIGGPPPPPNVAARPTSTGGPPPPPKGTTPGAAAPPQARAPQLPKGGRRVGWPEMHVAGVAGGAAQGPSPLLLFALGAALVWLFTRD